MKKLLVLTMIVIVVALALVSCGDNHAHSFAEWEIIKPATCIDQGTKVRYCDCGEMQTGVVPATGEHTEVIDVAVAPTCTEPGLTEGKHCAFCNLVIVAQSEISKLEHTYTSDFDATCETCGFTRDVNCSHINITIIPAKDSTCSETGLTEGKECSSCGTVLIKQGVVPTLPHAYGEWVVTKTANCGQDGEMTRCCSCGDVQTQVIYGAGMHTEIIDFAVEPTCEKTGLTEGKHCSYCGTVLVQQTVIPTLEHKYNTTYNFDNSFHWLECKDCGAEKNKAEHQVADDGMCTVCDNPIGATEGVIYDKSEDGTYAMVVAYEGNAKKIRIADTYQGLPVKNIYGNAFQSNQTITSVIIPDSVTSIGGFAFYCCYSLTSVVIPDGVTSIGNQAFYGCKSLTSVVIGDSVTSIGSYAFYNCNSLTSVVIPDSVTSIGDGAFYKCYGLTSVEIGYSVTSIGDSAFSNCYSLTSVVIPDSVTSIGSYAFRDCSSLTSVVIGNSVTSIGNYAFCNCTGLTSVVIGYSVTSIGDSAFSVCSSLTSVVIGDSVTSIGSYAFSYCSALKDVYYTGSEEEWAKITIGSSNSYLTNATIHYNYVPEN